MTEERKITRRVSLIKSQVSKGTAELPTGVTFLLMPTEGGGSKLLGDFPHVPMDGPDFGNSCPAVLLVKIGAHEYEPWCTRAAENGHDLHVAHSAPGAPLAAWFTDPRIAQ